MAALALFKQAFLDKLSCKYACLDAHEILVASIHVYISCGTFRAYFNKSVGSSLIAFET